MFGFVSTNYYLQSGQKLNNIKKVVKDLSRLWEPCLVVVAVIGYNNNPFMLMELRQRERVREMLNQTRHTWKFNPTLYYLPKYAADTFLL